MKIKCLLLFIALSTNQLFAQISVGETASDFTLNVLGSQDTITLSNLSDKVVYIFFYGAGCPHCKSNGPVTETQIYQTFKDNENFVAFGLDTWNNSVSTNNAFREVTGITYPLLLNARNVLIDYYGTSTAYDRSVVIGIDNILKYRGTGFVNGDYEDVNEVIEAELAALATSSEITESVPSEIRLEQNYPNPFNPSTTISFSLNQPSNVRLTIYNMLGQPVSVLANSRFSEGSFSLNWDASGMPSGVYVYRLETENQIFTKRMLLIK